MGLLKYYAEINPTRVIQCRLTSKGHKGFAPSDFCFLYHAKTLRSGYYAESTHAMVCHGNHMEFRRSIFKLFMKLFETSFAQFGATKKYFLSVKVLKNITHGHSCPTIYEVQSVLLKCVPYIVYLFCWLTTSNRYSVNSKLNSELCVAFCNAIWKSYAINEENLSMKLQVMQNFPRNAARNLWDA